MFESSSTGGSSSSRSSRAISSSDEATLSAALAALPAAAAASSASAGPGSAAGPDADSKTRVSFQSALTESSLAALGLPMLDTAKRINVFTHPLRSRSLAYPHYRFLYDSPGLMHARSNTKLDQKQVAKLYPPLLSSDLRWRTVRYRLSQLFESHRIDSPVFFPLHSQLRPPTSSSPAACEGILMTPDVYWFLFQRPISCQCTRGTETDR
jgi:hypothetical protein